MMNGHRDERMYREAGDREVLRELKRINRKVNIAIALQVLCLLVIGGMIACVVWQYQRYASRIDDAFETIQKIDGVVEDMKHAYGEYEDRIQGIFDTMDEIKTAINNLKELFAGLSDFSGIPGLGSLFGSGG